MFYVKLVEQVVPKQLMQHVGCNNLDNPHQSVYKTGNSTETALLHIKNKIHISLSHGKPMALVLLDLLSAFDTIDHDTVLTYHSLVCSTALKWFFSISATDSNQLKLGQPSQNCMSCCFQCHKVLSLALCFSLYTPLL